MMKSWPTFSRNVMDDITLDMLSPSITTAMCGSAPLPSLPSWLSASTGCAEQAQSTKTQTNKAMPKITSFDLMEFFRK
jgi:hypothetical protein